jgi:phenylalanyl-tRNA synthetase beta chain
MKISYNWLKQFIHIEDSAESTGELLTDLGLEVEGIETFESIKGSLKGVVVGHVLECKKHPGADKLNLTMVNIGEEEPVQIVCGAPNVAAGQMVPVATIGTNLYDDKGEAFKIKKGKLRGEFSFGMICSEKELGLGDSHEGIMVLKEDLKPGTPLAKVFDIDTDEVFEIGLTPNRSDAMSHYGVARDLKAGLAQKGQIKELISPSVSDFHVEDRSLKIDVEVDQDHLAPRYCGISISGVRVESSPEWLQKRLKAIGLSPINNVVDATNYVMHELGQPLHAFDAYKIKGGKVLVKTLPEGTVFTTLDGEERKLSSEDLMICDGESTPMCIAGVLGGLDSGVSAATTSIFLESAYFNPVSVRKTAKRHALNTDASFRFERGIDVNFVKYALKRAALLIQDIAGGKFSSDIMEYYPNKIEDSEVFLSYDNAYRLIGEDLPKDVIKSILASLEIRLNSETEGGLGLIVPSYRTDVKREADIIEEILRVYGYNNIEFSDKLNTSLVYGEFDALKIENTAANQLTAQGFYETMANSLTKPSYEELSETISEDRSVRMLNPLSSDLEAMRQSLLFSSLESVIYNINRKNASIKFFEFGKTYHKFDSGYQEPKHLSITVSGSIHRDEHWKSKQDAVDFFYLNGVVKALLNRLGIDKTKTKPSKSDLFVDGMNILVGKTKIAEIGIVKPSILKQFGIKQEVYYADLAWDQILKLCQHQNIKVQALPKFPAVRRDLSLLLDEKVSFNDLYNAAFQAERKYLIGVDLFDYYQGDKLPEGKKSYALSFKLQDLEKTLEEKQISKIMTRIQESFAKQFDASLR